MNRKVLRLTSWGLALAVLALAFAAYLQPGVAFMLATQLWNCF